MSVSAAPPGGTGNDIWASTLLEDEWFDGSLTISEPFSITHSTKHENRPAVAVNSFRNVVVFERDFSETDTDIYAQEFSPVGGNMGSPFAIAWSSADETHPNVLAFAARNSGSVCANAWSPADETHPNVLALWGMGLPLRNFAVWQRTEGTSPNTWESIEARRWDSDYPESSVYPEYFLQVTPWAWDNWTPAVATDGRGYLIAYAGKPFLGASGPEASPTRHIYGRIWWPQKPVFVPLVLMDE